MSAKPVVFQDDIDPLARHSPKGWFVAKGTNINGPFDSRTDALASVGVEEGFVYPHDDHPHDIIERMVAASWKREGALQYIDVLAKGDPDLKFKMLVEYRRLVAEKRERELS